ncbi:thermonuclease family protein [Roseibium aggregatum]|uniref:thermonuclease family protein n=1 Tax=Roseibium aggregatum TaxID=187304 RepID=UPI002B4BA1A8|nr:thermonuclease family protein [Roseibium aggregatum]
MADIMNGSRIEIARSGKDKYGRTLARVSVNGIDAGGILIVEGLARPWEGRRQPWC